MIVSASGGPCVPVSGSWSDTTRGIRRVVWLPDGRHFAGTAGDDVLVSDVAGAAPRVLIAGASDAGFVSPDIALYAKNTPQGADLVAQRFDPKDLTLTGSTATVARNVRTASAIASYTATENRLVYLVNASGDDIPLVLDAGGVVVDSVAARGAWTLRRGRSHPVLMLGGFGLWEYDLDRRVARSVRSDSMHVFPVWSPGDSLVAFARWRSCAVEVLDLRSGSDTTILAPSRSWPCPAPTDWTQDGRFLPLTRSSAFASKQGAIWTYEFDTAW